MNGLAIPMHGTKVEQDLAITQLFKSFEMTESLSDWGLAEARALFESVPMWKKQPLILLSDWEAKFHLTTVRATSRSVAAFKKYLGVESI